MGFTMFLAFVFFGTVICDHHSHDETEPVAGISVISRQSSKRFPANTSTSLNSTTIPVFFNSTDNTNVTFNGTMTPEDFNNTFNNVSDVVELGEKIKDAMENIMDGRNFNDDNSTTTEFTGIESNGCNRGLRKDLEEKCDVEYDRVNEEAQQIEDERQKTQAVCCALEDFEKCSLRAYDDASCATDKAAVRENLKAARLFLSVISNITCSAFRGQCAFYNSAAYAPTNYNLFLVAAAALASMFI